MKTARAPPRLESALNLQTMRGRQGVEGEGEGEGGGERETLGRLYTWGMSKSSQKQNEESRVGTQSRNGWLC